MAANIKDKEAFQRLNFLYQAAHCVLAQNPENTELARFYCFTQKTIAKRLVLRQRFSAAGATLIRCLGCGQTKKFPNNPKHQLWVDQPEAQLENQLQPEASPSFKALTPKDKPDKCSTVAPVIQDAAS